MSINKKRSITLLLAFVLLLSVLSPNFARTDGPTIIGNELAPRLTIHKYQREVKDLITGEILPAGEAGTGKEDQTIPEDAEALEGVEFTITQTHTFTFASGIWAEATSPIILKGKTNTSGILVFDTSDLSLNPSGEDSTGLVGGLELGRYDVRETSGPPEVILNNKPVSVDIPMTSRDGNNLNYQVHIYPKNKIIRKDVSFIKVGETSNQAVIKRLSGVKFKLFNDNSSTPGGEGTQYEAVPGIPVTVTSDSAGKVTVGNLPAGKYYFQEISTATDYAINTTHIEFEVRKTNNDPLSQTTEVVFTAIPGFVLVGTLEDFTVINYLKPTIVKTIQSLDSGSIVGTDLHINRGEEFRYNLKVKTPGDIKKYSEFIIDDDLDNKLEYITDSWEVIDLRSNLTEPEEILTKDDFTMNISSEENNKVKYSWTLNSASFSKLTAKQDITITFNAKIKEDTAGTNRIANEAYVNWNSGRGSIDYNSSKIFVRPIQGEITVDKFKKGSETTKLAGAVFKLTRKVGSNYLVVDTTNTGNVIKVNGIVQTPGLLENLTTGANGKIILTGLPVGDYQLVETQAPTGYRLLTSPIDLRVENSDVNTVKVANSETGWNLPTTGGIGTVLFTMLGILFMGVAILLFIKNKKDTES